VAPQIATQGTLLTTTNRLAAFNIKALSQIRLQADKGIPFLPSRFQTRTALPYFSKTPNRITRPSLHFNKWTIYSEMTKMLV